MSLQKSTFLALALTASFALLGCNKSAEKPAPDAQAVSKEHDHSDWWCAEHGIPESQCALCDHKLAEELKAKGDWCAKHDRPDSECFICHPELEAKFAALYEAKYGKTPPKPTADLEEAKENKKL